MAQADKSPILTGCPLETFSRLQNVVFLYYNNKWDGEVLLILAYLCENCAYAYFITLLTLRYEGREKEDISTLDLNFKNICFPASECIGKWPSACVTDVTQSSGTDSSKSDGNNSLQ